MDKKSNKMDKMNHGVRGLPLAPGHGFALVRAAMGSTSIVAARARPLNLPLRSPFGISGGAQASVENVLVEVELSDGTTGLGEGAPFPAYNGETQAHALSALESLHRVAVGRDVAEWTEIGDSLASVARGPSGSAQAAIEMACLDALCKVRGEPFWKFFGGNGHSIETDMTVTTGTAEQAGLDAVEIRRRGIRTIKVKVGGHGPQRDLERVRAILRAAPGASLILDGNAALPLPKALELAHGLAELGVVPALVEQWLPKDDIEGMRTFAGETGWLQAADESASSAEDVRALARAEAVQVVNIKFMKRGVAEALRIAETAREVGLQLMIGGNVESILAMSASAGFAAGIGGFGFADLDTPFFLSESPFEGGYRVDGAMLSLAHSGAGHGVRLPA